MGSKIKIKILDIILLVLMIIISTFLWWGIDSIVLKDSFGSWLLVFVLISSWFIVFLLNLILIEKKRLFFPAAGISLLISLFFTFSFVQLILIFIGMIFCLWAYWLVNREKKMIVLVEVWRMVRPARMAVVLILSLIISGQFYYNIISSGIEDWAPKIDFGDTEKKVVAKFISVFDSSFRVENIEKITVNEFVARKIVENQERQEGFFIEKEVAPDVLSELVLEEGRVSFSNMVGREVSGDEEVFNVFSEVVNNRINDFFQTNIESEYVIFIPWTIFIMLFLMTFSIISFLTPLLVYTTKVIFAILLKLKLVSVEKISIEKEVIVQF